jgi:hypothetical protein
MLQLLLTINHVAIGGFSGPCRSLYVLIRPIQIDGQAWSKRKHAPNQNPSSLPLCPSSVCGGSRDDGDKASVASRSADLARLRWARVRGRLPLHSGEPASTSSMRNSLHGDPSSPVSSMGRSAAASLRRPRRDNSTPARPVKRLSS